MYNEQITHQCLKLTNIVFEFSYSYDNKHNLSGLMLDSDQIEKYKMEIFKKIEHTYKNKNYFTIFINSLYFQKYNTVLNLRSNRVYGHL